MKHFPKMEGLFFSHFDVQRPACQKTDWYMVRLAFSLFHHLQPRQESLRKGKCASIKISIHAFNWKEWEFERMGARQKVRAPEKWVAMHFLGGSFCPRQNIAWHCIAAQRRADNCKGQWNRSRKIGNIKKRQIVFFFLQSPFLMLRLLCCVILHGKDRSKDRRPFVLRTEAAAAEKRKVWETCFTLQSHHSQHFSVLHYRLPSGYLR